MTPLRSVAGKDATEDFYALHRTSVLTNPRFKSLQIGTITDKKVKKEEKGDTPYGEAFGFWRVHSPYVVEYKSYQSHIECRARTQVLQTSSSSFSQRVERDIGTSHYTLR